MMQNLSRDDSVPADFYSVLEKYTEDGLRVLGMSFKILHGYDQEKIDTWKREEIEWDLTFIGFLIMENKIKKETFDCLTKLQNAEISWVMATGDNGLTAVSVGRQCGIIPMNKTVYLAETTKNKHGKKHLTWIKIEGRNKIMEALKSTIHKSSLIKDSVMREKLSVRNLSHAGYRESNLEDSNDYQFVDNINFNEGDYPWKNDPKCKIALTGKAFEFILHSEDKELKSVIHKSKIFARMSPENKAMLVTELQNHTKFMVGMWGDGANDCQALKAADVGLSLSEAEASIAAPFTSKIPNISPIIKLLREGRAALVSSFQVFKFMALYSMIQFWSVTILYTLASNLGDYQFLIIDLFMIIPLSLTMTRTGAYYKLDKSLPTGYLISFSVLLTVLSQIAIQIGFQCLMYYVLTLQSWFTPLVIVDEKNIEWYENTTIFLYSLTQYIAVVIVFSVGKPFRKPVWSNYLLTFWIIFFGILMILLILVSAKS